MKKFRGYRIIIAKFQGIEEKNYTYTKRLYKAFSNDKLLEYMYII